MEVRSSRRKNTVLVPVKTGESGGFRMEAHKGKDGTLIWQLDSDYTYPPSYDWMLPFQIVLATDRSVAMAGAGGTVIVQAESRPGGRSSHPGRLLWNRQLQRRSRRVQRQRSDHHADHQRRQRQSVFRLSCHERPRWTDERSGTINEKYRQGHLDLRGRCLRRPIRCRKWPITADRPSAWTARRSTSLSTMSMASRTEPPATWWPSTAPRWRSVAAVRLKDVAVPGNDALLFDDSTASPTVGPDGDVYYGILENPFPENNDRGWLLHFDASLTTAKTPGAFGWDITPSIVPATAVPSYTGTSSYLILTKYNNYVGLGTGDGVNQIAVQDPNDQMTDPITGATVMKTILTVIGPTPDPSGRDRGLPQCRARVVHQYAPRSMPKTSVPSSTARTATSTFGTSRPTT